MRLDDEALPDILTTIEDVISLIGGAKRVADLTRSSRTSVWNWRKAGKFPPVHYRAIREVCQAKGCEPSLHLFAFADVRTDDFVAA